jgi:hypothetical protein
MLPMLLAQRSKNPMSGRRYARLTIRNAIIIDGNGTPASGPKDIVIEGNVIREVGPAPPIPLGDAQSSPGEAEIDASGKYVLPGLINAHGHVHDERGGIPQPLEYQFKMWLACGVTSVRDVGSDTQRTIALRKRSSLGELPAPRLFVYGRFAYDPAPQDAGQARARIQELKRFGVDGVKLTGMDSDLMEAAQDEARKLGLRIAHHAGLEETNAWDDVRFGTASIEHWYGIPEAALNDAQELPPHYNYSNETDRFRYAGRLWRQVSADRLAKVLDAMAEAGVAWVPTLAVYEANRDLQRAQTQPWFEQYLHPSMDEFFRPNPANHGSYFIGWTSTDETFWKENFRLWMDALIDFERRGGLIGAGEDAGYIYQVYGFGLIRELELHQEAGFQPLSVIRHATGNNAKILGEERRLGRIRPGYLADLIVVNGNPLENFKVLYPGIQPGMDSAGVEWTVKDGIPYHGPTLLSEVRAMVAKSRAERMEAPAP